MSFLFIILYLTPAIYLLHNMPDALRELDEKIILHGIAVGTIESDSFKLRGCILFVVFLKIFCVLQIFYCCIFAICWSFMHGFSFLKFSYAG